MSDENDWKVIVPPLPEQEAEKKFRQWKKEQEDKGMRVRPEDVRRDLINQGRGQGCVIRYLVRTITV